MRNSKYFLALGLAGALTLGAASQAVAAPAIPNTAAVRAAATDTINVQWRRGWGWRGAWGGWRGGWGWGPGLGVGLGLGLAGAAFASPYYGCGYGPCGYGYGYGPDYAYAPAVVVGPGYGWGWRRPYWRRHWW